MAAPAPMMRLLGLFCLLHTLGAVEVTLAAPLTTRIAGWQADGGAPIIRALVEVPPDAPADLGVGAWVSDPHGRWFQRAQGPLTPGRHVLAIALDAAAPLASEPAGARSWDASQALHCREGGLFFWSASASRASVRVSFLPGSATLATPAAAVLTDLTHDGAATITGQRWAVRFRPAFFPADPYGEDFQAKLVVTGPEGHELAYAAFYQQPMQSHDRGDREQVTPAGQGWFAARWRARVPGVHQLRLEARWPDGTVATTALGTVTASGEPRADWVTVDGDDPRFLSAGGALVWPLGPNLRSVWDVRCRDRLNTTLTPDRGTFSYDAYLTRAAAGGANACEIWLSSWNLALEWHPGWEGFHGLTAFNEDNAWRLDAILDRCEQLGVRVNLVLNNHGQGSDRIDKEWDLSPWNIANGGPLSEPYELFTDPRAIAGQARLRRYLVARYGDSPAILAWKLWSEINLTAGGDRLRPWHESASQHLTAIDPWQHPVTTHWSGDYRAVDQSIASLPSLGMICIDAYHGPEAQSLLELLNQSLHNPHRGLSRLGKPILVTEFGGNWDAAPVPQIEAEFRSGAWLALVNGFAGAPMLWWFEWIDQTGRWEQYGGIRAFLTDEDLRGREARHQVLPVTGGSGELWCGCWSRPGRRLGYLVDRTWAAHGGQAATQTGVTLDQGSDVPAGPVAVSWWDPDSGALIAEQQWEHPGGALVLSPPDFTSHLAFKLRRTASPLPTEPAATTKPPTSGSRPGPSNVAPKR